jgi:hypothetical protein
MTDKAEELTGVIGVVPINGRPVIYAIVPELPSRERQQELPHLAVISWKYNGDANNGMPEPQTNERMQELERILCPLFEDKVDSVHAYNRTGDNLKEFTYHVGDPGKFMTMLNEALRPLPRFPIKITFVHDEDWSDFQDIASLFARGRAPADA